MASQHDPNAIPMPSREELLVALLAEELKSRRFFNTLAELGMDNPYHRPVLDAIILRCLGLNDDTNETMDFFCALMDAHAALIGIKEESVRKQALEVYGRLVAYRDAKAA